MTLENLFKSMIPFRFSSFSRNKKRIEGETHRDGLERIASIELKCQRIERRILIEVVRDKCETDLSVNDLERITI